MDPIFVIRWCHRDLKSHLNTVTPLKKDFFSCFPVNISPNKIVEYTWTKKFLLKAQHDYINVVFLPQKTQSWGLIPGDNTDTLLLSWNENGKETSQQNEAHLAPGTHIHEYNEQEPWFSCGAAIFTRHKIRWMELCVLGSLFQYSIQIPTIFHF